MWKRRTGIKDREKPVNGPNHEKHTTVDKKRTLPEKASAQGHLMEPPEKPTAKELMNMPESAGTPHQRMLHHD